MFICCICGLDHFISSATLLSHIRLFHSHVSNKFNCKQSGCTRIFDEFRSFSRHMASHDTSVNSNTESVVHDRLGNNFTSMEISDEDYSIMETDDTPTIEDCDDTSRRTIDLRDFQRALLTAATHFVASLYNNDTLTKSHIQLIVDNQIKLLRGKFFQMLKKKVTGIINYLGKSEQVSEVEQMFDLYENMFQDLDTEYKRTKNFQKCGAYIKPESYITGSALDNSHVYGITSIEPVDLTGQFIPMRFVLKSFLELPNVWQKIDDYMNVLNSSDNTVLENVVQGKLWKEKIRPFFIGKTVLPLTLYFDGYETCNTGTHTGVHKLGAVYYNIACMPPEFQGSLENIFLALIFYASDQHFGNYDVFRPLLNELLFLENEGITIVTEDNSERQIFFALCLFLGDNLGIHSILGFVESFQANYSCRRCKIHRDIARTEVEAKSELLRARDNYDLDVTMANVTETGIKEKCIWHVLKSFHVTENVSYDIMHDLDEGAWKYDMCNIIDILICRNRFSYNTLNDRVQGFAYQACEAGNKPPIITKDHVKNRSLVFSAAEMLCFVRYFGLMIGDLLLIPEDSELWHFYQIIRQIVDIVTAPAVHSDEKYLLSNLVTEHHKLYLQLFPNDHLKPKHHFMLHYSAVLEDIGPLSRVSSLRFEAKHKPFKQVARISCNYKNLPLTLAGRHQLKFCYRLLCRTGLESTVDIGPRHLVPVNSIDCCVQSSNILPADLDNAYSVNWVTISGIRYQKDMVLVVGLTAEFPILGIIKTLMVDNESNDISFLLKQFDVVSFNEHYHAYEVVETNKWVYIQHGHLITPTPTHVRIGVDGKYYVTFRYKL